MGTRVPLNTQAPLIRAGSRSAAGQDDQSSMRGMLASTTSVLRSLTIELSGRQREDAFT